KNRVAAGFSPRRRGLKPAATVSFHNGPHIAFPLFPPALNTVAARPDAFPWGAPIPTLAPIARAGIHWCSTPGQPIAIFTAPGFPSADPSRSSPCNLQGGGLSVLGALAGLAPPTG